MPIQILVTKLTKTEVSQMLSNLPGAADVLEIVDPPTKEATCLVRSTVHNEVRGAERQQVVDLAQQIADADSLKVRQWVKAQQEKEKAEAERDGD
jgi:hypothetical protein